MAEVRLLKEIDFVKVNQLLEEVELLTNGILANAVALLYHAGS